MTRGQQASRCRVIVVNKSDHDAAECARVLDELRDEFGPTVLPLNLPADGGKAVVDCFGRASGESDLGPVADWHQKVIDQVVEVNETVMDQYLDLGARGLPGDELPDAFQQSLREGTLVPVCFVSAPTRVGLAALPAHADRPSPHPAAAKPH